MYAIPHFWNCNAKKMLIKYNVILTVIIIAGLHKYRAPSRPGDYILHTLMLNICGSSVWNLLHVTLLALGNLRWFLDFRRIYGPHNYRISNLLRVSDVSGVTASFERNGAASGDDCFLPCSRHNTDSRSAGPLLVCELRMLNKK